MLLTLPPAASAAGGDSGFYRIGKAEGIEISPIAASGAAVSCVARDADGDGEDDVFYPGSRALAVTLADTAQGEMVILTVSSSEKTFYVDQQTGGGDLSFRIFFTLPDSRCCGRRCCPRPSMRFGKSFHRSAFVIKTLTDGKEAKL